MARVNRTTGILLTVMVLLLVGTVAGSFFVPTSKQDETLPEDTRRPDAHGHGRVDIATGVSTPVPGVAAGVIASVDVKEGEEVKAGQTLYRLDDRQARAAVEEAEIGVLNAKQGEEIAEQAVEERKSLIEIQKAAIKLAKAAWDVAYSEHKRLQEKNNVVKNLDTEVAIAGLHRNKAYEEYKLAEFKLQELERLNFSKNKIAVAKLARQRAELALKSAQRTLEQHIVKAPCNGFIAHLDLNAGEQFPSMPNAMQPRPKIVFLPDAPLIVRADIEQSQARFVQPGMPVTIRDHNPSVDKTWEGEVVSLSRWVIRPRSILVEPDQINDARSREVVIRVKGNPADFPFVVGADVRVQIHIEKK